MFCVLYTAGRRVNEWGTENSGSSDSVSHTLFSHTFSLQKVLDHSTTSFPIVNKVSTF